jgi:hypothetical protein
MHMTLEKIFFAFQFISYCKTLILSIHFYCIFMNKLYENWVSSVSVLCRKLAFAKNAVNSVQAFAINRPLNSTHASILSILTNVLLACGVGATHPILLQIPPATAAADFCRRIKGANTHPPQF